jgi:hypothetical protein
MEIARIPNILAWSEENVLPDLDELHAIYSETLAHRLGCVLGRTQARQAEEGSALTRLIQNLPDSVFERLLTAPETSYRLLWPSRHAVEAVAAFLHDATRAEWARMDHPPQAEELPLWTALGDFCLRSDGSRFEAPTIDGWMVVDFKSPNGRDLSRATSVASEYGEEARYPDDVCPSLVERLIAVMSGIEATNRNAARFVARFTNVIMYVKAGGAQGEHFWSRSPERHIGLTVLVNAHLPDVDDVKLGEALIHEAIHSLVDTYETLTNFAADPADRWIRDAALYDGTPRVISPWTSTRLVVPTYIHACFVWYGIVQFWSEALDGHCFPVGRVLERLRTAVKGFLSDAMLDQLTPFQDSFHPELMLTLNRMRRDVVAAFDAMSPSSPLGACSEHLKP